MKEGYYQKKIADFSEKLQYFEKKLEMAETEYERFQLQLGEFKQLLKKLKQIEEFKERGIHAIAQENQRIIEDSLSVLSDKVEKNVEQIIHDKANVFEQAVEQTKKEKDLFDESIEQINQLKSNIQFYKEFQNLLMLKLINKGVLNHRELNEIEMRVKKRMKND